MNTLERIKYNNSKESLKDFNKKYFSQQTKGTRTMPQPGTIEQISQVSNSKLDEINTLINSYNQEAAEILMRKESGEYKNFTPEYVQELVKQASESHLAKYKTKIEALLKDSLDWLEIAIQKKESIRFPFRNNSDFQKAQLSEMKSLRAQSFVNSVKNENIILNELVMALRSNDTDYFNSLVNYILIDEPETEIGKSDLLSSQPGRVKLFADVRKVYKDFSDKNNLVVLDIAIQTLLIVSTETNQFLAAVNDNSVYFMPQRMVSKMDQNEVARHIEAVNGSLPYYETKLENLNFVHSLV